MHLFKIDSAYEPPNIVISIEFRINFILSALALSVFVYKRKKNVDRKLLTMISCMRTLSQKKLSKFTLFAFALELDNIYRMNSGKR